MAETRATDHIGSLDGLRGLAALWVLTGHVMLLTNWRHGLLAQPDLAVDLFMVLSGFLMTFHAQRRGAMQSPRIWVDFWSRRFFRIAPVYFTLLIVAFLLGPFIFEHRQAIAAVFPTQAQKPSRYLDHGWANILTHITFLFGQIPAYSFRTALPDWSIGLEMAFYAVFPFLMLAAGRVGMAALAVAATLACVAGGLLLPGLYHAFPMPSFLPLKLNVFIAGMLVADAMGRTGLARYLTLGLAVAISGLSVGQAADLTHIAVRCACTMALALMVEPARYPGAGWLRAAARALGGRLGHWLGELSYSVYLIHLLFLTPIASLLITAGLRGLPLFASSFALTVAFSYAAAGALHIWVEKPGIAAGKYFNAWSGLRPAVAKAR